MSVIQTVGLTAALSDWSEWGEIPLPKWASSSASLMVCRERVLMVGQAQLAKITEHARPNGVRQYIVHYTKGPSPWPKFDTYEQAHAFLDGALA